MKIGLIKVSDQLWDDKKFRDFFDKQFRMIGINEDYQFSCKVVKCESPLFDDVKELERIPFYDITITENDSILSVSDVSKYTERGYIPLDKVIDEINKEFKAV